MEMTPRERLLASLKAFSGKEAAGFPERSGTRTLKSSARRLTAWQERRKGERRSRISFLR